MGWLGCLVFLAVPFRLRRPRSRASRLDHGGRQHTRDRAPRADL